jgi:hypothetical protein
MAGEDNYDWSLLSLLTALKQQQHWQQQQQQQQQQHAAGPPELTRAQARQAPWRLEALEVMSPNGAAAHNAAAGALGVSSISPAGSALHGAAVSGELWNGTELNRLAQRQGQGSDMAAAVAAAALALSNVQASRGDSGVDRVEHPTFGALRRLGSAFSTLKHDHLKVAAAVDLSEERDQQQRQRQHQHQQQQQQQQHREHHLEPHLEQQLAQQREEQREQQYALSHPGSTWPSSCQQANSWTDLELRRLLEAVDNFGRDWKAVARYVGNKSNSQCHMKVDLEVRAGRMREPEGKQTHVLWTEDEYAKLVDAIGVCGRDWKAVAARVGTRTRQQCRNKVLKEVEAGRMEDPERKPRGGQQRAAAPPRTSQGQSPIASKILAKAAQDDPKVEAGDGRATSAVEGEQGEHAQDERAPELERLLAAVAIFGRDFASAARCVDTLSRQQCRSKLVREIKAGRIAELGNLGARERSASQESGRSESSSSSSGRSADSHGEQSGPGAWIADQRKLLVAAATRLGHDWPKAADLVGKSALECAEEHAKLRRLRGDERVPGGDRATSDALKWTAKRSASTEQLLVRAGADASKLLATHALSDETVAALEGLADLASLAEAGRRSQVKCVAEDDELDTPAPKRVRADQ